MLKSDLTGKAARRRFGRAGPGPSRRCGWLARVLAATVLAGMSLAAAACPLCMGWGQPSKAQRLVEAGQAVLALPASTAGRYRVVEVIKGERPASGVVEAAASRSGLEPGKDSTGRPLLLLREGDWPVWTIAGTIGAGQAGWLRQVATGKRMAERSADDWPARVVLMLPYLEHAEPLAAEIAYQEIASAPYPAMVAARSRIPAPKVRQWVADPALAARQPLYLLLLGIAGTARDADWLELRLEAAWQAGDATHLGPMIAADLQLRGPSRLAWVESRYLRDTKRSTREIQAVLLALSVHGNANDAVPRELVIASYRAFMRANKPLAGLVAQDLAAWQYWDAVPEYVALMKSDAQQHFASRALILEYLRRSPGGAQGLDRALPDRGAAATSLPSLLRTSWMGTVDSICQVERCLAQTSA